MKTLLKPLAVVVVAWTMVLSTSRSDATSVKHMSMREIADLSSQVCWATIESSTPRWSEGRRAVETVFHVVDAEFMKGSGPRAFDWVVPGGTIDGITMSIAGAPTFAVGERWMLCLLPSWKTHPCAGIWQGAFRVEESTRGPIVRGASGVVTGLSADTSVTFLHTQAQHVCTVDACSTPHAANLALTLPNAPISLAEWNALLQPLLDASARVEQPVGSVVGARVWTSESAVAFRTDAQQRANSPAKQAPPGARRGAIKVKPVPSAATTREAAR